VSADTGEPESDGYAEFAAFVQARQRALLRSCYLLTGDRDLAEDLLQGALTKLAQRWQRVSHGSPEGYVRTVLYRDMVSWRRRHWREQLVARPPEFVVDNSESIDNQIVFEQALRRLTRKQRAVLVLRFYEDLSEAETARVLGVSLGTVKSQCHAALGRLRTQALELGDPLGPGEEAR